MARHLAPVPIRTTLRSQNSFAMVVRKQFPVPIMSGIHTRIPETEPSNSTKKVGMIAVLHWIPWGKS